MIKYLTNKILDEQGYIADLNDDGSFIIQVYNDAYHLYLGQINQIKDDSSTFDSKPPIFIYYDGIIEELTSNPDTKTKYVEGLGDIYYKDEFMALLSLIDFYNDSLKDIYLPDDIRGDLERTLDNICKSFSGDEL